jgi:hypothetical protein
MGVLMSRAGRKAHEVTLSEAMIERVLRQWRARHPGCTLRDLTAREFSRLMMQAMRASAVQLPDA